MGGIAFSPRLVETASLKCPFYGVTTDTEHLREFSVPNTFDIECVSRRDIELRLTRVFFGVVSPVYYLQIFQAVVQFVTVNVMDVFVGAKRPTQMLLHKVPMLVHLPAGNPNTPVSCFVDAVACTASFVETGTAAIDFPGQVEITKSARKPHAAHLTGHIWHFWNVGLCVAKAIGGLAYKQTMCNISAGLAARRSRQDTTHECV